MQSVSCYYRFKRVKNLATWQKHHCWGVHACHLFLRDTKHRLIFPYPSIKPARTMKLHQSCWCSCGHAAHTTLEEFENRGLTSKTHQMFPVHTTLEEFKNTTTGHFGRVVEGKTRAGNLLIIVIVFDKLRFRDE